MRVLQSFTRERGRERQLHGGRRPLPRGEHADGRPERRLLPVRSTSSRRPRRRSSSATAAGSRSTATCRSARSSRSSATCRTSSTRSSSSRSSTTRSSPQSRRSTRSPTCSTRSRRSSTRRTRVDARADRGRRRVRGRCASRYGRGPEVLHGIDLDVPAGTTVALVGHTGAGKSTIAKLLARFYDPTDGRITIDGIDLRDVDPGVAAPPARHRPAGRASSSPARVAENIAFGRPEASARRDRRRRSAPSAPTSSSTGSRTATTRSSASAAHGSRSASASSSRSRARCSPTRGS